MSHRARLLLTPSRKSRGTVAPESTLQTPGHVLTLTQGACWDAGSLLSLTSGCIFVFVTVMVSCQSTWKERESAVGWQWCLIFLPYFCFTPFVEKYNETCIAVMVIDFIP